MKVLLNGGVARRGLAPLSRRFGDRIELREVLADDAADVLAEKMAWAEVLISMNYDTEMPPAPNLKLLHVPASGLDTVALDAVPAGVAICNVYEHETGIAEYVLAGMLEWVVELAPRHRAFKAGDWAGTPRLGGAPRGELAGQTVGCLGYGNIGQAVARRALAFDMRVEALTRRPRPLAPEPAFLGGYGDLADFLPRLDFLVVCCPLSETTRGMIGTAELAAMKPGAVVINVARGHIVDEDALYDALREHRIAGAILDTWYQYPSAEDQAVRPSRHPFHDLDNVLMTPHVSGWTEGQQLRRWARTGDNIEALMGGGDLINVIRQPSD